ncbi:hypothetical protein VDQ74_06640 [Xanthomonas campestris pv. campestris]|nr:hypothetical protein [Xanthomonas campestris pv. campestris]
MQAEVIASIIAAATALVAVVVSPFLAARTSKNQMIGPMRQAWINDLRNTLSNYSAHMSINRWYGAPSVQDAEPDRERKELDDLARVKEAIRLREKLFLLLNPREDLHMALADVIQSAFDTYMAIEDTSAILVTLRQNAQVVLKTEWDVVRRVSP